MSIQNVEKFVEIAAKDTAIMSRLADGVDSIEQLVERAIGVADHHGITFSAGDAIAWIADQQRILAHGELNDIQLESVAGGKKKSVGDFFVDVANESATWFRETGEEAGGSLKRAGEDALGALGVINS